MSKIEEDLKRLASVQLIKVDAGLVMEEQFPGTLTPKILAEREALTRCDIAEDGHCNSSEFGCCLEQVCQEFKRIHRSKQ